MRQLAIFVNVDPLAILKVTNDAEFNDGLSSTGERDDDDEDEDEDEDADEEKEEKEEDERSDDNDGKDESRRKDRKRGSGSRPNSSSAVRHGEQEPSHSMPELTAPFLAHHHPAPPSHEHLEAERKRKEEEQVRQQEQARLKAVAETYLQKVLSATTRFGSDQSMQHHAHLHSHGHTHAHSHFKSDFMEARKRIQSLFEVLSIVERDVNTFAEALSKFIVDLQRPPPSEDSDDSDEDDEDDQESAEQSSDESDDEFESVPQEVLRLKVPKKLSLVEQYAFLVNKLLKEMGRRRAYLDNLCSLCDAMDSFVCDGQSHALTAVTAVAGSSSTS